MVFPSDQISCNTGSQVERGRGLAITLTRGLGSVPPCAQAALLAINGERAEASTQVKTYLPGATLIPR